MKAHRFAWDSLETLRLHPNLGDAGPETLFRPENGIEDMPDPLVPMLHYTEGDGPELTGAGAASMFAGHITDKSIFRILFAGFGLVIVLLVVAGVIGIGNLKAIKSGAASLVNEQDVTTSLIDEIQREQESMNAVYYALNGDPETVNHDQILKQLEDANLSIDRIVKRASGSKEEPLWLNLHRASHSFSDQARALLAPGGDLAGSSQDLFRKHEEVIGVITKLIDASHSKARTAQVEIESQAHSLVLQSSALLGLAVLLALLSAILTTRMATGMFRKMEWQAGELSRVSWHMLENQESVARRFSHELHDELGQSLTALKANLLSMKGKFDPGRLEDSISLVDDSIQNVREISQLLRPTVLDDFGLDASLRAMSEKFQQRTGTEVEYESNLAGRLSDEVETHLFRIAQEALTNVARHSGATKVKIALRSQEQKVRLSISDNGKGLQKKEPPRGGLGMIGMRARARSAGGEFTVYNGRGLTIDVWVPATMRTDEQEDANSAG
jgi:signal transduction histidine kinase